MTNNNKNKVIDLVKQLLAKKSKKGMEEIPSKPSSRFHWKDEDLEVVPDEKDQTNEEELFEKTGSALMPEYPQRSQKFFPDSRISREAKAHYRNIDKSMGKHHMKTLEHYTGSGHASMNKALRGGRNVSARTAS